MIGIEDDETEVVNRRHIAPVEDRLHATQVQRSGRVCPLLDDDELGELVSRARPSATSTGDGQLDVLTGDASASTKPLTVRNRLGNLPNDIATLRAAPFERQALSVICREVTFDAAVGRDWQVHRLAAKTIEPEKVGLLSLATALGAPRVTLGAPWNKDCLLAFPAAHATCDTR